MSSFELHTKATLGPRFEDVTQAPYGIGSVHALLDQLIARVVAIATSALEHIPKDCVRAPTPLVIVTGGLSATFFILHRIVVRTRANTLKRKHAKFE